MKPVKRAKRVKLCDVPFEKLLESARGGGREAVNELLHRYRAPLRQRLDRECPGADGRGLDASGIVQDTMWCLTRDLADFQGQTEEEFVGWARVVLQRRLLDAIKKQDAEKRGGQQQPRSLDQSGPNGLALRHEIDGGGSTPSAGTARKEQLDRAITKVPEANREIVRLYHIANRTLEEIALRVELSAEETAKRYHLGLRALRRILDEQETDERSREKRDAGGE